MASVLEQVCETPTCSGTKVSVVGLSAAWSWTFVASHIHFFWRRSVSVQHISERNGYSQDLSSFFVSRKLYVEVVGA